MIALLKGIIKFIIYGLLLFNLFLASVANVFTDHIQESNSRFGLALLLLILFISRKYILMIPKSLIKGLIK
ncbi:hypothetical protein D1632_00290 [Chryseobacterium nematophagum]|uniref:Uncharacterized protein n=1 Tax=Chryseobacterium nematophagum TaxID=2305228 RepID=A0A3M7LGP7_9FLAO|nr:hypothetical protein [Chryseobacterium nematophagum]RMZ61285.1 hypothetical protein D1632_00290 [Chryseobacterium nematophagum]